MLPWFDCRAEAVGIVAIGHQATGVIAIGQFATGVIAIGQVSRGVIAIGQLALGIVTVGQLGVGLLRSWGMLAVGARASGLLKLSVIPSPPERTETGTVQSAGILEGHPHRGWIRVVARPAPDGGVLVTEDGVPLALDATASPAMAQLTRLRRPTDLLLQVHAQSRFDDSALPGLRNAVPVVRALRVDAVQPAGGTLDVSVWGWIARAVLGLVLAATVAQFGLRPVVLLFMN